jgi:hypothetical protein
VKNKKNPQKTHLFESFGEQLRQPRFKKPRIRENKSHSAKLHCASSSCDVVVNLQIQWIEMLRSRAESGEELRKLNMESF